MTDWGSRLRSVSYFAVQNCVSASIRVTKSHQTTCGTKATSATWDVPLMLREVNFWSSCVIKCEKWFPSYSAFILLVVALANKDGDRLTCTFPDWQPSVYSLHSHWMKARIWGSVPKVTENCSENISSICVTQDNGWNCSPRVHVHVNSCEEVCHNPINIPTYQYELWINRPLISDYFFTHAPPERRGASMLTQWWKKCTEPLLKLATDKFSASACKY